ncbi:PREDICTED: protein UPSTREAM OF FLC [Fragaria vesca subsp. vesca]|uniref:protein UPSTREAM OF FLC n=1 Tax=Fragaria vesca subsp. vesca TaxID=101020 RepID=UPI0002C34F00|nr:PREDICTED: protein UPSTREAM OF FLC [Fragaria vesca subsp. vesca]
MAVTSRGRPAFTHLQIPNKWRDSDTSPDPTQEPEPEPKPKLAITPNDRKVPVVYYLSRNGQLEHPHFMEVPLSSPRGLFLRDVINRLNLLRGKGMATMYSWSAKRGYKTGFVWHDLSENDFIHPSHGNEYVLKGSELLDPPVNPMALQSASSRSLRPPPEIHDSGVGYDSPVIVRRRNQSWSSIDLNEYKVYKTESVGEAVAADASTQTEDKRHGRRVVREEEVQEEKGQSQQEMSNGSQSTELSRDDISPPPSDSSPETLETLMKADGRLVLQANGAALEENPNPTQEFLPGGKMKASSVLMQLLSCGSISFRDCGSTAVRDQRFSLIGQYKNRLPRGAGNQAVAERAISSFTGVKLEEKEYFSGSLIETKKEVIPALKRSCSYNADRSSQMQLEETEKDGVRAKCIPRKPKSMLANKKETSFINNGNGQEGGSKRLEA